MLMSEHLVNAHVSVAPAEMCGGLRFYSRTGAACYGIDHNISLQDSRLSQRQQRELYAGGKTSRIGYVLCLGYERAMGFGQTINVIVSRSCYSEILSKVYDFYVRGHGIVFKEFLTLAMPQADKQNVNLFKRKLVGESKIGISEQTFMDIREKISRIAPPNWRKQSPACG